MNELQQKAFEIFMDSANLQSDFKPLSEEKISAELKTQGLKVSSSTINRWKAKFGWQEALENKISLAINQDDKVKALINKSSLESVVENTKVDIERNNVLIAASYEVLEREAKRILSIGGALSNEDFKRISTIATLATTRHDRMLDRAALMPSEALSSLDILERIKNVELEVEDAQIISD